MRINKIILYNFNSFEGWNEFDFSCNTPDKNIILIGGKNGAGKTSLFLAIKIALYGSLAYGYLGVNPHYIAKIKDCINFKSFQKETVKAAVHVNLSLMVEREVREYEIIREWDCTGQKLIEKHYIKYNGEILEEQESAYFQNYLHGLIPPGLFDFFLFDGEQVGTIFSTNSYNTYIKNAVYTLCGLDVFEIVRKYSGNYTGKATNENEEEVYSLYEQLKNKVEVLEKKKSDLDAQMKQEQELLEQTKTDLIELETAFKNAGGITKTRQKLLTKKYEESERLKAESAAKIKIFMEGLMPFFIVREFSDKITNQLDFEEKEEIYYYVQQKLNYDEIKLTLNKSRNVDEKTIDYLMDLLLGKFKPKGFEEGTQLMHDLSKEGKGKVNAMISSLDDFDTQEMIQVIKQKQTASDDTAEINRILKNAMTEEDSNKFMEQENLLLKKKDQISQELLDIQNQIDKTINELQATTLQRDKTFQKLKDTAQDKHVFELSSGLTKMMSALLSKKTAFIRDGLETLIVTALHQIYRKDNLITHVEIGEDFQFSLYQNATYEVTELNYLMKNLGKEAFASMIGKEGKKKLFELYGVNSMIQLQQAMNFVDGHESIELYKKIDLSRLSKGERQIFILSMYWAIIELSGKDIPFIIDTPYARIDAGHRKEISEKFFPNISKQVIILSTDEEINEEYYGILKPYIAKEFLLVNDEAQNRTSVEQRYFFER